MRKVSMRRLTSPSESLIGLPASTHRAWASSSARSLKRATQCISTSCFSKLASRAIGSAARTAPAMASSMISGVASAVRKATSPVYLSVTARSVLGCTALLLR